MTKRTVHPKTRGDEARSRQQESSRQQRRSPHYSNQQQRQPSYPTTIEFTPSQDPGLIPFDEADFDPDHSPFRDEAFDLSLNEVSLEDTFGFNVSSNNEDQFERIYTENEGEDGTFQSSIDLNPYSAKDFGAKFNSTKQKK